MITVDQIKDLLTKAKLLVPHAPTPREGVALTILIGYAEGVIEDCAVKGVTEITDNPAVTDAIKSVEELYNIYALN